jgi:hypothetical protein
MSVFMLLFLIGMTALLAVPAGVFWGLKFVVRDLRTT